MGGKIKLLVVDDEPGLREMLSTMFEDQYDIYTVANGREGMDALEKDRFDCVLCDIAMPKMDGITFIKEVRKRGIDIPFIFFTAYATRDHMIETLKYGAFDFIGKPRFEGLASSVERAVKAHRLEQSAKDEGLVDEYHKVIQDIPSVNLKKILFVGSVGQERQSKLKSLLKERLILEENLESAIEIIQQHNVGLIVSELIFQEGTARELYLKVLSARESIPFFIVLPEGGSCEELIESNGKDLFFWREIEARSFFISVYSALQEGDLKSEGSVTRYVRLRVKKLLTYDLKEGTKLYAKNSEQRYIQISKGQCDSEQIKQSIRDYQERGVKYLYLDKVDYIDFALEHLGTCSY